MALWELLPGMARWAGRRYASRYLGSPLPQHLGDLRAGQRSWSMLPSKRSFWTAFRFDPPLDRNGLLSAWTREPDDSAPRALLGSLYSDRIEQVDELYSMPQPDGPGMLWLLVDNGSGVGVLHAV